MFLIFCYMCDFAYNLHSKLVPIIKPMATEQFPTTSLFALLEDDTENLIVHNALVE